MTTIGISEKEKSVKTIKREVYDYYQERLNDDREYFGNYIPDNERAKIKYNLHNNQAAYESTIMLAACYFAMNIIVGTVKDGQVVLDPNR